MNRILKYFLLGQAFSYGGILLSMLILPEGIRANDGVSYYGAHLETAGAFCGGLLIMAACTYRVVEALPQSTAKLFKALLLTNAILLVGIALTPFGNQAGIAETHVLFSKVLFGVQFLTLLAATIWVRRSTYSFLLLGVFGVMLLAMVAYWAPIRRLLIVGELICQAIFSLSIYYILVPFFSKRTTKIPITKTVLAGAQKGFTIIELMIATTVFSLVLLLCSLGVIQIGRTFNKGVTSSKTQEAARTIIDDISRAIQFSGGSIAPTPDSVQDGKAYVFCVDDQRYSYVLDRQVKDNPADDSQVKDALVVDTYTGCNASSDPLAIAKKDFDISSVTGAKELIPVNMRLAKLQLKNLDYQGDKLYEIVVRVVAGEDDLLDTAHDKCQSGQAGAQFCAASELTTVVQKRL